MMNKYGSWYITKNKDKTNRYILVCGRDWTDYSGAPGTGVGSDKGQRSFAYTLY